MPDITSLLGRTQSVTCSTGRVARNEAKIPLCDPERLRVGPQALRHAVGCCWWLSAGLSAERC